MALIRFVEHEAPDQEIDTAEVEVVPRIGETVVFDIRGDRSVYRVASIEHHFKMIASLESDTKLVELRCRCLFLGGTEWQAVGD